jgi:hypothetical protein
MENEPLSPEEEKRIHGIAASMIIEQKKSQEEAVESLVSNGVDRKSAISIAALIAYQHNKLIKKYRAKKDMVYGALLIIAGTIALLVSFGYFFWGAIALGLFLILKGIIAAKSES